MYILWYESVNQKNEGERKYKTCVQICSTHSFGFYFIVFILCLFSPFQRLEKGTRQYEEDDDDDLDRDDMLYGLFWKVYF